MDAGDRPPAQTFTCPEQPKHDDWTGVRRRAPLSHEDTLGREVATQGRPRALLSCPH